jgi:hypothetical protein
MIRETIYLLKNKFHLKEMLFLAVKMLLLRYLLAEEMI